MRNKIIALTMTLSMILSSILLSGNFYVTASEGGQTLYVGGTGEGNYTKIQDAIENATSGDTVFVYSNTYSENIVINKSINLIGQNKNNTVINGNQTGTTVTITSDWVNLSGFTIQNNGENEDDAGIKIESNYTNISSNIIKDCDILGLFLEEANYNNIYNNIFTNILNTSTIYLCNSSSYNIISSNNITNCCCTIDIGNGSHHNNISDNNIINNSIGIYLLINSTSNNSIFKNTIYNSTYYGIFIDEATNNNIFENLFEKNDVGIKTNNQDLPNKNIIYHNNFINNTEHFYDEWNQTWDNGYPSGGNYWDDYTYSDTFLGINQNDTGSDGIGDTPYDISIDDTQDKYPLIYPWGEYSPVSEYNYSLNNNMASFNGSFSFDLDGEIVSYEWDFGDESNSSGVTTNHSFSEEGLFNVTLIVTNEKGQNDTIIKSIFIGNDTIRPEITNIFFNQSGFVTANGSNISGVGFNVTINATVNDNVSGVNISMINITYPDGTYENYTMNKVDNVYSYVFSDTWQNGRYNYTIWTKDYADNTNDSIVHSFNVSSMVDMSICTNKDSYGDNETINLTDPPGSTSEQLIGYKLLDNNTVLRIWNRYDSYYFNTSNGVQFTNHKDNYWSHNVLMLGYYNNDVWHLIYRSDELSGFNKNISTDDETFVNATLWKDLTHQGYNFRLAIRYHLGVDDNELTVIPYIKNLGQEIPYMLGFAWEINDIQVDMTPNGDYIEINGTSYYLNTSIDETYTDLADPCYYIREDKTGDTSESLHLRWDENLNYSVLVKSKDGQYNAPVTLGIKIGTLGVGQEKYTEIFWYDASTINLLPNAEGTTQQWTSSDGYSFHYSLVDDPVWFPDNNTTYVYTGENNKIEEFNHQNNASYENSTINSVTLVARACAVYDNATTYTSASDGYIDVEAADYSICRTTAIGTVNATGTAFDVGQDLHQYEQLQTASDAAIPLYGGDIFRAGQRVNSFPESTIWDVELKLSKYGAPTGTAYCCVRSVTGDTLLGTIGSINVATLTTTPAWKTFSTTPVYVSPAQNVRILIEYSGGNSGNFLLASDQSSNVTSFGYFTSYTSLGYTDFSSADMTFRVYYETNIVNRSYLFFDTSYLPNDAVISNATLKLYGKTDLSVRNFYVTVQSGMPTYPHDSLVGGDFNLVNYAGDGGTLFTQGFSTVAYNNLYLNSTGIGWISKTGTTKFCLRSSRDIGNNAPDSPEYVSFRASEAGGLYAPYLVIKFSVPNPPDMNLGLSIGKKRVAAPTNESLTSTYANYQYTWTTWGGSPFTNTTVDSLQSSISSINLTISNVSIRLTQVYLTVSYTSSGSIVYDPYPPFGSTGVCITPVLNITASNYYGNNMNITWSSNSSGSWQVFGTNNSVGNGTYHQIFSNASVNGQWWYWKVNVNDGISSNESSVFKFYTGNQSLIEDTGNTDIKGYLLMQVQYYNCSLQSWVVDHTVIEDTTSRMINNSEQLGLDILFNGLVNTWNLSYGNGTYRVYTAFKDINGYVLQSDDDSYMETSYQFQVSFSADSDYDGLTDYMEIAHYHTQQQQADTDNDGYNDYVDIDPLVDLEVSLTVKRIYASEYTYTWREGEDWDFSETNCSGAGDGTNWLVIADSDASGGYYTRQNDDGEALDDFAEWIFTVNSPGIYHIWMRSHRFDYACSNVTLWWIDDATSSETRIYNRDSDGSTMGTEVMWYEYTEGLPEGEWKWSWYGVVDVEEAGSYTLKIINSDAYQDSDPTKDKRDDLGYSHGDPKWWMEVDNILITDDPNCIPDGKGIENSNDNTIGYISDPEWDDSGGAPDFYVKTTIAGTSWTNEDDSEFYTDKYNILTDIKVPSVNVPDNVENVPITIELWDKEDGETDTLCDINSNSNDKKVCDITYNLKSGTWCGDDYFDDTDFIGRTCGEADGNIQNIWQNDADVIFNISQNDYDNDGITYKREVNVFNSVTPFKPKIENDRYAVIIGGGASCKVKQMSNSGNDLNPGGPNLVYNKGSSWTDYIFQVDLMTNEESDYDIEAIGVMFRYQNTNNFYILKWKITGFMYLDKVVNGIHYNIGKNWDLLIKNNWYTINVTLNGNNIKIERINENGDCRTVFDITDYNSLSSGSIALFCWKNIGAWFDDVRVVDSNNNVLLVEGFDYGLIPSCDWILNGNEWIVTGVSTDQEEMYKELDFLYRELINVFHYNEENIYYLSAHKWRDADGDGRFDVDDLSMKSKVEYALETWLKDKSDSNDLNFIYIITHGGYVPINTLGGGDYSSIAFDSNRNGVVWDKDNNGAIKDSEVKDWLKYHNYGSDIGRLVFLLDSCFSGHYNVALCKSGEPRIIMTSSSIYEPAELETGQDWGAFSYKFFTEMADGVTNVANAFNDADEHINTTNFMSIDVIMKWDYTFWPQNGSLDDNGNGLGNDYNLPTNGDWCNVYQGISGFGIKKIPANNNYKITKARVRFNTQLKEKDSISAELYEIYFHKKGTTDWITPNGFYDQWNLWDNEENAYDGYVNTNASCTKTSDDKYPYGVYKNQKDSSSLKWFWTPYLEFTLPNSITYDKINFIAKYDFLHCNIIDIDVYYSGYQEGNLASQTGL